MISNRLDPVGSPMILDCRPSCLCLSDWMALTMPSVTLCHGPKAYPNWPDSLRGFRRIEKSIPPVATPPTGFRLYKHILNLPTAWTAAGGVRSWKRLLAIACRKLRDLNLEGPFPAIVGPCRTRSDPNLLDRPNHLDYRIFLQKSDSLRWSASPTSWKHKGRTLAACKGSPPWSFAVPEPLAQ